MEALESERTSFRKGVQHTYLVRLPGTCWRRRGPRMSRRQGSHVRWPRPARRRETQRNSNTNRATHADETEAEFEIARAVLTRHATVRELDCDGDKTPQRDITDMMASTRRVTRVLTFNNCERRTVKKQTEQDIYILSLWCSTVSPHEPQRVELYRHGHS